VSGIDHLVADVLRASSWNPGVFMGTNPARSKQSLATTTMRIF